MAEYIKREAAVKAVEKYGLTNGVVWGRHTGLAICIASEIAEIPAADVAPVVHARWMPFHSDVAGDIQYCTACGVGFGAKTDYCPHCGARMGGSDDADAEKALKEDRV